MKIWVVFCLRDGKREMIGAYTDEGTAKWEAEMAVRKGEDAVSLATATLDPQKSVPDPVR